MFNEYPYVNLQDVNLDWILKHIKDLETNLQDFVKLNTIKYADPIIWNITKQYETNTVVIDGNTGTAYLSVQPVPAGVALTNDDYWTVIFTLNLTTSNQNITFRDDGTNVVATFDSDTGDWILWNFYLYRVTQPIAINTAYVEGFNIERYSVELFIKDYINKLAGMIGNLDDLTTSDKTSIVEAVNSLVTVIGDLDNLNTSVKTSIVNAINSVLSDLNNKIGDLDDLDTSDKTSVVNAINSILTDINPGLFVSPKFYGAVGDGIADDTLAIQTCINNNDYVVFDGDFLITDTITLHSNMYILGMGKIINTAEFKTSLYAENVSNLIIDGVSFVNGTRSGSAYTTENGNIFIYVGDNILIRNIKDTNHNKMASILLDTVTNFEITSCIILKSGYSGVMCYGNCKEGNIHHNRIEVDNYTAYANSYGIALSCTPHTGSIDLAAQCIDVIIDSNILWTVDNNGHWEGIDTHAGLRIKVTNNKLKGFMCAIRLTRYNNYTDPDGSPHNCEVSGNDIIGATTLTAGRTEMLGIHIAGNQNVFTNCSVNNNHISKMDIKHNGVDVGTGIVASGDSIIVDNNTFQYSVYKCIELRLAARCTISNNVGMMAQGTFIDFNDIKGSIIINDNSFSQGNNFYNINSTTGLDLIIRYDNKIMNAYWKDNTPNVTNISDFVPDYVNVSPAGSAYHPRGMTAIKSIPASGSPEKWVCDGTTWRASANLT